MAENEHEGNEPEGTTENAGAKPEELGDGGKRALEAERKARRAAEKRAQDAEARIKAAEDAEKTEVERLQSQVADLTKQAEASTAQATRFEVAAAKGLSLAQARRLVGSTKEELEADADEMRTELGLKDETDTDTETTSKDESTTGLPKEDLRAGASNDDEQEPNAAKLADSILSRPW